MADSSHNESRLKSAERQNMADPIHSVAGSSLTLPSHSETGPKSAVTSSIADPSRIGDGLSSPVRPSNLTIEIPHTGASAPAPFEHHGIQFGTFDEDGNPPTPPYIASADSTYHTAREFAERSDLQASDDNDQGGVALPERSSEAREVSRMFANFPHIPERAWAMAARLASRSVSPTDIREYYANLDGTDRNQTSNTAAAGQLHLRRVTERLSRLETREEEATRRAYRRLAGEESANNELIESTTNAQHTRHRTSQNDYVRSSNANRRNANRRNANRGRRFHRKVLSSGQVILSEMDLPSPRFSFSANRQERNPFTDTIYARRQRKKMERSMQDRPDGRAESSASLINDQASADALDAIFEDILPSRTTGRGRNADATAPLAGDNNTATAASLGALGHHRTSEEMPRVNADFLDLASPASQRRPVKSRLLKLFENQEIPEVAKHFDPSQQEKRSTGGTSQDRISSDAFAANLNNRMKNPMTEQHSIDPAPGAMPPKILSPPENDEANNTVYTNQASMDLVRAPTVSQDSTVYANPMYTQSHSQAVSMQMQPWALPQAPTMVPFGQTPWQVVNNQMLPTYGPPPFSGMQGFYHPIHYSQQYPSYGIRGPAPGQYGVQPIPPMAFSVTPNSQAFWQGPNVSSRGAFSIENNTLYGVQSGGNGQRGATVLQGSPNRQPYAYVSPPVLATPAGPVVLSSEWNTRFDGQSRQSAGPSHQTLPYRPGMDTMYPQPMVGGSSVRVQQLTRNGQPTFQTATEAGNMPFSQGAREARATGWGVMKIGNIPYGITKQEVLAFLGRNAKIITPDVGEAIHIIMERTTGKTMDCYIEMFSQCDAQATINKLLRAREYEGRHLKLGDRHVDVEISSQEALMKELFPRAKNVVWKGSEPVVARNEDLYSSGFKTFITSEELVMMVKYAEQAQRFGFSQKCPHRTYENMISILHKFPWFAVKYYTVAQRDLIFSACQSQIRALIDALRGYSYNKGLTDQLLTELLYAGLNAAGFSERQRCKLVEAAGEVGQKVLMSPLAQYWPWETIGRKQNQEEDLVQYYVLILRNSVDGLTPTSPQYTPSSSPFGNLETPFPALPGTLTMDEVGAREWQYLLTLLGHVLSNEKETRRIEGLA